MIGFTFKNFRERSKRSLISIHLQHRNFRIHGMVYLALINHLNTCLIIPGSIWKGGSDHWRDMLWLIIRFTLLKVWKHFMWTLWWLRIMNGRLYANFSALIIIGVFAIKYTIRLFHRIDVLLVSHDYLLCIIEWRSKYFRIL